MIQLPYPPLSDAGGANSFDMRRYMYQVADTINMFFRDLDGGGVRATLSLSELPNLPTGATAGAALILGSTDRYYVLIGDTGRLWTGTMHGGEATVTWREK